VYITPLRLTSITLSTSSIEVSQKGLGGWPTAALRISTSMAPSSASTRATAATTAALSATSQGRGRMLPSVAGSAA